MVRPIILSTLLLATCARADSFDFTPGQASQELDGMKMTQLVFRHGERQVGYTPPGGWAVNGGGATLTLTPNKGVQAEVTVQDAAAAAPSPFNEARVKILREEAAGLIPGKAEQVEPAQEKLNDFRTDGHEVFESVTAYSFYGQKLKTGLIVINFEDRLLRCRVRAPAAGFDAIYAAFRRSLFSFNTF